MPKPLDTESYLRCINQFNGHVRKRLCAYLCIRIHLIAFWLWDSWSRSQPNERCVHEFICSLQNSWLFLAVPQALEWAVPRNHQRFNLKLEVKNLVGSSSHSWWLQTIQNHRKKQKKTHASYRYSSIGDHIWSSQKKGSKSFKIIKMTPHTIGFRSPSHLQASHSSTSTSESHLMGF